MPPPAPHDPTLPPLSPDLTAASVDTLRPAEQLALIRADQRKEWLSGRRMLAEAYLARFPDLAGDSDCVLELLLAEFRLRTELGERPTVAEYARRFPSHGGLLGRRLGAAAAPPSTADTLVGPPPARAVPGPVDTNAETQIPTPKRPAAAGPMPTLPGYELLGELGRGAMGVVYRARQKSLGREVALKIMLSGQFAGKHELERFRAEAVQLAALHHPNIVQIYEVGEFDGRPNLALEYVPGGSMAKVFETHPLAPRPAAELGEQLARAAQHAHERGIIHRDLKPANILLAADGSPKITDFGLAKGGGSVGDTASYAVLGTPSYMAPEQAGGQSRDVGPTADVYALGSILYEALTGRPPFRAASILDTIQLVTSAEPIPPGDLTVNLPRDLETITLKCLQKEPAKRYASAADLAADLRRFLDGEPIHARPVPAWEKVWKWTRRRPAWAALFATVVLSAAGLFGAGVWFNAQVRRERDVARTERDRANENATLAEQRFHLNREAVDRYFTDVSESDLLEEPGLQPLREKLLGLAKDYYARFVAERRDDPSVRADLARSLGRLAKITADLKDPREAIKLYRQALPLFEDLGDAGAVAGTWYELSKLYRLSNQVDDAEAACTAAVNGWTQLVAADPAEPKYLSELARSYTSRSNLDFARGRVLSARETCERALSIRQRLAGERPNDPVVTRDLATTWDNLANIQAVRREWADSNADRRQAAELFRKLVTAHPYRALYRNDLARVQFNLGSDLLRGGQPEPAADAFREAAEQWDRLHALHAAVREYAVSLGNAEFALSQAARALGKADESDTALAKSKAVRADLVRIYPAVPQLVAELARCDGEEGVRALARNQPAAAAEAFQRAADLVAPLAASHPTFPQYRADLALHRLNLGKSLALAGRSDQARTALTDALGLYDQLRNDPAVGSEAQSQRLDALYALGDLQWQAGEMAKALELFDRCLVDGEPLAARAPPVAGLSLRLRNAWWGKAKCYKALGRIGDQIAAWDHAIALDDGSQQYFLKVYRLQAVVQTDEYPRALLDLDLLAGQARTDGLALFEVSRVYALAARTAAADTKHPQPERDKRSAEAAGRAVEHLRLAQTKAPPALPTPHTPLDREADFDALRGRADFRELLAAVNAAG